jgi:predicted amidohydrolase YtcJ
MTRDANSAEFAEGEKGMHAPGMLGDPAVLWQNVFTVRPRRAASHPERAHADRRQRRA